MKIKKGPLITLILCILSVFLISNVSAGIYFSQLDSVYNLGDMVEMGVNVSPENEGPLKIVLFCDNNSLDIYKGAPTELIQLPLTSLWMNGMTGDCYFRGYYGGGTKDSTSFKISKKLEVSLYTTSFFAKPGEAIKISGNVKRLNGEGIDGDIEIDVPLLSGSNSSSKEAVYGRISRGEFSVDYIVKKDTPSGDYRIDVLAFETTGIEKTSEGVAVASLQVYQALKNIDIALDTQNIDPGNKISFKPILNDQSDNPMYGDVAIEIKDENQNSIFERIVKSGDTVEYTVPSNTTSGYYEIDASTDSASKVKKFYVAEKQLVAFELVNGTLIVTNIGNVPYNKSIQIDINGKTLVQKINSLMPGEKKEYKLKGEQESNSIKVSDGVSELQMDNVILPVAKESSITGAFVGISQLTNTPIIWIIILVILAAIILFFFRDVFKKKSVAYPAPIKTRDNINVTSSPTKIIKLDNKGREIKGDEGISRVLPFNSVKKEVMERGEIKSYGKSGSGPYSPLQRHGSLEKKSVIPVLEKPQLPLLDTPAPLSQGVRIIGKKKEKFLNEAEQVLVTDGQKNRAAIIALKIKNSINKFSKENLEKAIEHVYDKKGAVYEHGNMIFVIFSPIITKSFRNEIEAAKDAERIAAGLKEHNRKFNDKIEFGIAVNSGEIINKIEDRKLKFTSLGTLTIAAKKLAELSHGEVLMTKEAYEKAMAEVKADKKIINGTEVYEVKKVADYEKNKKFINDFLKREGENKSRSMIPNHSVNPKPAPYWVTPEDKAAMDNYPPNSSSSANSSSSSANNSVNKIFD